MNLTPLAADVLTIVGEIVAVVLVFLVLGLLARRIVRRMAALPSFARRKGAVELIGGKLRLGLTLLCLLVCLAVAGLNAWWLWQGEHLPEYTLAQLRSIPERFWIDLAIAAAKTLGLAVVTALLLRPVRRLLALSCAKACAFEGIRANDESIEQFFESLRKIVTRVAWLFVLATSFGFLGLPEGWRDTVLLALRIYLIIATGLLLWRGVAAVIESLDALSAKYSKSIRYLHFYKDLRHLVPVFRRAVEYAIYVVVATLVVQQIELTAGYAGWGPRLIRIIGIVFVARLIVEAAYLFVEQLVVRRSELNEEQRKRRRTITPVIRSLLKYAIYFSAAVMVLKELGGDPTPVLAGAGILGLAVGLGAQNLISDFVSGFFILFEEYFLVGDFIEVAGAEGVVESIDLRATHVRDNEGRLHVIRNGNVDQLINYSKKYTYAVVEVGVAYESDLDHVYSVIGAIGAELSRESDHVLEPIEVMGLDNFGESELTIRTRTKVAPGKQLPVERLVRKRIKEAFDANDVEIPYARRVVLYKPMPEPAGRADAS